MSFFGTPSGSLFGANPAAAQSQAPNTSIFASTSNAQPATSLFDNLSKPQTTTSSLFSNLPSTQASSSAFFKLPTSTAAPSQFSFPPTTQSAAPSSMFGTQPIAQVGANNSLFGALPSTQTQNPPLFGASTTAPQVMEQASFGPQATQAVQGDGQANASGTNGLQTAYFNSLLEKNRQRTREGDRGNGLGDIPSLQLGLGDISKRARELGGVNTQAKRDRAADTKVHYLLAASGVNPGTTQRELESLGNHSTSNKPIPPTDWDPDSHKYVEQLQQQSTLKMISEGMERAHRNFNAYLETNVDINWDEQRRKIYQHFGLTPKGADSLADSTSYASPGGKGGFGKSSRRGKSSNVDQSGTSRNGFGLSGMQKSVIGTPGVGSGNAQLFADTTENKSLAPIPLQDDRSVRDKQTRYAERVQRLNEARLQQLSFPILEDFASVEVGVGGETPNQLLDAYKALIDITGESSKTISGKMERQYAEDYLDENPNSPKSIAMRKRVLQGSRRALEKRFYEEVESLVAKNPREANLGGIPSSINRVRAYLRIRHSRRDLTPDGVELQMVNGDLCWALVFFLLRSGLIKEAGSYVREMPAFQSLDRNLTTAIMHYANDPDHRLPMALQNRLNQDYQQKTRIGPANTYDPYRMACYKVVGRCDLSKRSIDSIKQGVDDWIWLQFSLAREVSRTEESQVFGLSEVQDTILQIGLKHFSKDSGDAGGYATFFYLQILAGLFERAVSYLYAHSYVAAVHFAIALDYHGLLRVSDFTSSETELLTLTTKEEPQINFGRMIGYYTRDFRAANVEAATDYLTLLCLNADLPGAMGKAQSNLCHEALRELVLETREYTQLLGDFRTDGTHVKGIFERRLPLIGLEDQEAFMRSITLQAASIADDNGRTTDAVLLYHLAADYENVLALVSRALSDALATDLGTPPLRLQAIKPSSQVPLSSNTGLSLTAIDDPIALANQIAGIYDGNALLWGQIRPQVRNTLGMLILISRAKAKAEAGQWADAIDSMAELSLIPLNAGGNISVIRATAANLNSQTQPLQRLVGPLLLWAITALDRRAIQLQSGSAGGEALDADGGGFESDTRRALEEQLRGQARDLMVFAGLVKLRLGKGIWEALVRGTGGSLY